MPFFIIIILSFVLGPSARDIGLGIGGGLPFLALCLALEFLITLRGKPSESTFPESQYVEEGDYDKAISICLEILKRSPSNLRCLMRLRTISFRRHRERWGPVREINLLRFAMVCALSILSSKFIEWDMGEVNWWPFAEEDEIMMVRPYIEKRLWRLVSHSPPPSLLSCALSHSQPVNGHSGYEWIPVQRVNGSTDHPEDARHGTAILNTTTRTEITPQVSSASMRRANDPSRYRSTHRHFQLGAIHQAETEPTAYLPCFTSLSGNLFHIVVKVKDSKVESDQSVFRKMNSQYRGHLESNLKSGWSLPARLKSLRAVHLVKVHERLPSPGR